MTLKTAIDSYFDQMPYMDGTTWTGSGWGPLASNVLEPLSACEDYGDHASMGSENLNINSYDGVNYSFWSESESGALTQVLILPDNAMNSLWDGDRRLENKNDWGTRNVMDPSKGNLSPFDIDNNGLVELPFAINPNAVPDSKQSDGAGNGYDKARVTQFLATHEIGHALAGVTDHTDDHRCCMFEKSNNWKRDNYLSNQVRENVEVHNHMRAF